MDKRCYINSKIHLNLANKFSNEYEEMQRESIRSEIRKNLCDDLQIYKHSDENYYCIFHLPNKDKNIEEFREASRKVITKIQKQIEKLNDLPDDKKESEKAKIKYDFRYALFPCDFGFRGSKVEVEMNFSHATFLGVADFMKTEFLGYANFDSVTFHKIAYFIFAKFPADAYFFSAKFLAESDFKYTFFSNGKFTNAVFSGIADFESSEFARHANFINVSFLKKSNFEHSKLFIANFENAKFSDFTNFASVEFLNSAYFKGNNENVVFGENATLNLQDAKIENPQKISFHTVRLEPHWFVNTDASDFAITACQWRYFGGKKLNVMTEIQKLKDRNLLDNPHKLLTKTCWQLADNHEESKSFPKASVFRQIAQESKRKEDNNGWKVWSWHWWYWLSSFYGESPLRAGLVLFGVLSLFAIAFMFTDFQVCPILKSIPENPCKSQLNLGEAFLQSLASATFQSIEYIKPSSKISTFLIILEKIFAPVQAALLALAIRRKFMR